MHDKFTLLWQKTTFMIVDIINGRPSGVQRKAAVKKYLKSFMPLTFKSRRTLTSKIGRDLTGEYVSGVCLHSWALDET